MIPAPFTCTKKGQGAMPLAQVEGRGAPPGFGQSPSVSLRLFHVKDVENSTRCLQMETTCIYKLYAES